ncbi:MAG: DNA polymerase III subunit beta [Bacteroidales bacterium]|jgi:DNA polymerase-3 subunit beta|uniref:DNA polymerase III subunit beta n=1 Tax=Prevotellamassilia timonensis TaxID=1852370 RepID=UPI00033D3083|nr:DNA polymerase III subunit beta [Prevotellamassilia timonensis]CDA43116.1 dNA polymerase III subunit beta [Prevotella sp. CAG:5226]
MKFVISSSVLSSRLMTIGRVIVQKNTIPILDCFCFDIQGTTLTITASDNDTTLTAKAELNECDSDVRFAVNAKTLQDAIKEIPDQPLECYLNTESYELTVEYQNGQYKLMGQSAEEYPTPAISDETRLEFDLECQKLVPSITRCMIAAANDTLRPQLNTICFDIHSQEVSLVSSNGNQLALTKLAMPELNAEGSYLLGTRPASLLKGMLAKAEGNVHFSLGQRTAIVHTEEYSLTSRLVEGRFPNYRSVIPQDNPNIVTVNRLALVSALRRVLVFANAQAVLVKFRLGPNTMNISSQDIDFGKSAEENMLCDYMGTPMRIAFKGSVLLDLINNIEGDDITLKLSDPSRAGLIVPAKQKEGEEVLMLIMPSVFND